MRHLSNTKRCWVTAAVAVFCAILPAQAHAGQFDFGALIRAGFSGSGQFEIGLGPSSSSLAVTGDVTPFYSNGTDYLFEIGYLKSSNTAYTRVHQNTSPASGFSQVTYNPAGGAAAPTNAIWTLPASSFFASAAPTLGFTAFRITGLSLQGITGAVNIIQPIQQTTMTAAQILGFFSGTVQQSQNIVFQADPGGNWRLRGVLQLWGLAANGGTASGSQLAFGVGGSAQFADVHAPEPATIGFALFGLSLMFMVQRRSK